MNTQNNDKYFCDRVWSTDEKIYISRLRSIGFENLNNVLDLGAGCGQWSNALASINSFVDSVEPSGERVLYSKKRTNYQNIKFHIADSEKFEFKESHYDAVFCYSMIYFTDISKTLDSIFKSLKKDGLLYICGNNLEFYFYNYDNEHNNSDSFDSKKMSINVIENTISNFYCGNKSFRYPVIYPSNHVLRTLKDTGFEVLFHENEGMIGESGHVFFPEEKFGKEAVYEILARKGS